MNMDFLVLGQFGSDRDFPFFGPCAARESGSNGMLTL